MRRTSRRKTATTQSPKLYRDQQHKADLEARNALLQFDRVVSMIGPAAGVLKLTVATTCELQWLAIRDIYTCAGRFRTWGVLIDNTSHCPPPFEDVSALVEEMCDYANSKISDPIHTSAYLMWRFNWIHPFGGGNGRTSRAVSYLALCVGLNLVLPGSPTMPDQIVADRQPYYAALDAADAAWIGGQIDVSISAYSVRAPVRPGSGYRHRITKAFPRRRPCESAC